MEKNQSQTKVNLDNVLSESQLKENDVFSFRYNEQAAKKHFQPYHCFDGTLIVKRFGDKMFLVDTYWSGSGNREFSLEKAIQQGELTFLCNLDEMVDIKEHEKVYYDDADIVELLIHAGYRNRFLIKKGTQRSQSKMLQSIKQMIKDENVKIRSAENSLKRYNETLKKIEAGDTSVYL